MTWKTLPLIAALVALVAVPAGAQSRRPAEIANDLDALLTELQASPGPQPPPTPQIPVVRTAAELTAALQAGGDYTLAPGTYAGNFTIGKPTRLHGVPGTGRVAPADVAAVVIAPANPALNTLTVTGSDVLVEGLTLQIGNTDRTVVMVGDPNATTVTAQPKNVTFDRIAIVVGDLGGLRGLALHGVNLTITRSYLAGFYYAGRDSQAILAVNGPGPYTIEDNFLEAASENILFGGSSVKIPNVVPGDIVVRGNTLYKRPAWRGRRLQVKNSLEFKCARRVLVEGNQIDGNWKDAQDGSTIMLTVRNQYGDSPWCMVDDVTVRDNVVKNATDGYAVNILGHDNNFPSAQTQTITLEHNLFVDARNGIKVGRGVATKLTIARNTFPAVTGQIVNFNGTNADGTVMVRTPLAFDGNVGKGGAYGIKLDGVASGNPSLAAAATVLSFTRNVLEGTSARTNPWPAGTTVLPVGGLASKLDADWHYTPDRAIGW